MSESDHENDSQQRWIEDEGLLRDEGVIFGLSGSGAGLEAKLKTIRTYFDEHIEQSKNRRENLHAQTEELDDEIEEVKAAMNNLAPDKTNTAGEGSEERTSTDRRGHLLRYIIGILLAAGASGLSCFIIYEQLASAFSQPVYATAAVCLAGLFTVFQPTSLFFSRDRTTHADDRQPELWKRRLVEFGMPFVVAFFVIVWRPDELTLLQTCALFLFVFMVFLLCGKLLLSILPELSDEFGRIGKKWKSWWNRRRSGSRYDRLSARKDDLTERRNSLRDELTGLPTEAEIGAKRDSIIELFRSEYELAREAVDKGLISERNRRSIVESSHQ